MRRSFAPRRSSLATVAPGPVARWSRPRWPELCVASVVFCCSLAFFFIWRFAYQSDHVMCGLMAKSILTRGERPLFLWTLGYNGILVEAYAVAAAFWLFGVHVYSYYLFTLLCFFGLCALYRKQVALFGGRAAGLCALLGFAVSSPDMYRYIMRPQPNYTEIVILGLLLMLQIRTLVAELYVQKKLFARFHFMLFASTGLTLGFALYTYQLVVFFVGSTMLWLSALYLRDAWGLAERPQSEGGRWNWLVFGLRVAAGLFAVGIVQFLCGPSGPDETRLFQTMMKLAAAIAFGSVTLDLMYRRRKLLLALAAPTVAFLASAVVGYTPALYFKYVQHGYSRNRLQIALDHAHTSKAFSLFMEAHWQFLNADGPWWKQWIGRLELVLMATFAWRIGLEIVRFIRGTTGREALLRINPLAFLPVVILPLFCVNQAAVALESAKWTTCIWLFYSLSQTSSLLSLHALEGKKSWAAYGLATLLLANNGHALASALTSQEAKEFTGEKLIAQLEKRRITRAYSEYWYAYSINFYTNEKIIVEPVFNNYCPHYGSVVARSPRIAFIDPVTEHLRGAPDTVFVNNVPYKKTDEWFDTDVGFLVLEKMEQPGLGLNSNPP